MTMNTVEQVAAKNIIRDLDETRPLFAKILNNLDAARRGAQHLTNEDKDEMEYIKGATLDVYLRIAKYSCTLLADNPDLLKEEEPEQ